MEYAKHLANLLSTVIINPLLALIFAAGLIVFVWGIVQYMFALSTQGKGTDDGKRHMWWGIVGMFIMVAAAAILKIIINTLY